MANKDVAGPMPTWGQMPPMGKTEAQTMLEIETAITALGPEAQRRVIDWIRARWMAVRDDNGGATASDLEFEPQFAIRGTPLTSPWPHEKAAKASSFRQGVLEGGIGGEDVEQLISAADEAESLNAVFEAGPSAQTTMLFRKLATDSDYRQRMKPFLESWTPWWLATAGVLSKLGEAELDDAIENLSSKEGYDVAKRCFPEFWPGSEWWGTEEQWNRAKAIVKGNVITSSKSPACERRAMADDAVSAAHRGEEDGVFFAPGDIPHEDAIIAAITAQPEKAQAVEAAVRAGDLAGVLKLLGLSPDAAVDAETALDIAEAVAGVRHGVTDPTLWNTTFRGDKGMPETRPHFGFSDRAGPAVKLSGTGHGAPSERAGVLSQDPEDEALAMLDEADWAAALLGRLCSSGTERVEALAETRQQETRVRLRRAGISYVTIAEAVAYGAKSHGIMGWLNGLRVVRKTTPEVETGPSDGWRWPIWLEPERKEWLALVVERILTRGPKVIADFLSLEPYIYIEAMYKELNPPTDAFETKRTETEAAWYRDLWDELRKAAKLT